MSLPAHSSYVAIWPSVPFALYMIPEGTELPRKTLADDDRIPAWDTLSTADQELFAKHMEVYAAAVTAVDDSVGTLLKHLEIIGERENTIVVIASDNGGSADGGPSGTRSYFAQFGHGMSLPEGWVTDVPLPVEDIGGPRLFSQYPLGWARVSNTPFRSFKSTTYEGGVHAPLVISWPGAPAEHRGIRDQFVFVSDIAPTILELTGVSRPTIFRGAPVRDVDGESIVGVLTDAENTGRDKQHFECVGRRALIDGDWKAVSPTPPTRDEGATGGKWELYNIAQDPTETLDLSSIHSERLASMQKQWRDDAWENAVFPLDDDGSLHNTRPESEAFLSDPVSLRPFRPPLERFRAAKLTTLRSFVVDMTITVTASDEKAAEGVLVSHGDQGGGYLVALIPDSPMKRAP